MKFTAKVLFAMALGLAGLAATDRAAQAQTVLFNCFFPPQHYACREMLVHWGKEIEKATEGRVKFRIPPKSLAAPPDQYDGVVNGVMDSALQFNAFIANKVTGVQVGQLPFVGTESAESASVALWRTYAKYFAAKDEYKDVVLLGLYASNGAEFFSMTDKPIETVEDIAGRKMWALPGVTANLIKATGSPVVAGPAVQMLEIVSKGVVDGYTGVPISSVHEFKLTSYTKSATVFSRKIFQPTFSYLISKKKWNQISEKDRAAIMAVSGEKISRWFGAYQDKAYARDRKIVMDAGVKVIAGNPATLDKLVALGKPAHDAWLKKVADMGVDGAAAIAHYQGIIAEENARRGKGK